MRKTISALVALLLTSHLAFASFLGDPTTIKGGGTGLATLPAAGQILIGNAGGTAYALALLSGDATMASTGALTIATNAITNAKAAQMAAHTHKGNNTGSTANAIDLTSTQLTADLNLFTSGLQGLVPASGGGTTNFLRADGTFAAPTGTGDFSSNTSTSVDGEIVLFSGTGGKTGKRATGTGYAKITSGVLSAQSTPLPAADLNGGRTVNAQTGTTYTLALSDGSAAGGFPLVSLANASAITATVPTNASVAFPIGTQIDLSVDGAGSVTVAPAGGVTVDTASGSLILVANSGGTLIKKSTNGWTLYAGANSQAITSLTGDVTGTGPGTTAATIANLAVTNAKIANSTIDLTSKVTGILPNANTTAASANTASAIVTRDGSGNFIAGTITAALTGTASGNLTATATNHGVLVSGSGNAASVTAVGATNTLLHGNTGADPTYSAVVNADITNATIDLSTKVNGSLLAAANLPAPALSAISASDIDWSTLKNTDGAYTKTLAANTTFTFSNIVAGQTIVIFITNTASNFTVTWPASAHFPAGTAPTETVGAKLDVITCKAVSTSVAYCQSVQNFTP